MPSPRPSRAVSLADFTDRPIGRRKVADLPPRARQLIELKVWEGMTLEAVAAYMGIGLKTARGYMHHANARAYYLAQLAAFQDNERATDLHTAVGIRDRSARKDSAAHQRVAIESMRFIEGRDGGIDVNLSVGVGVGVIPAGYQVEIGGEYFDASAELLRRSRSTRTVLDRAGATEAVVIDEGRSETASPSTNSLVDSVEPELGRKAFEQYAPRDSRRRIVPTAPLDDDAVGG